MNPDELTFRKAIPGDEGVVLAIMRDAALWLQEKGIAQWKGVLRERGPELVQKRVQDGVAYLAYLHGEPVGTVTVMWDDEFSWGELGLDKTAGYIHGLAIKRQFAGKGLGREILNWAMEKIRTQRPKIRLDCMAENPRLCRYYEEMGFRKVDQRLLPNGFKVNLYEKNLS